MPLLRNKPKLGYCGLTIVMSNPSRFDLDAKRLLTANGGQMFDNYCLRPEFNSMQCDVRLVEETEPLLEGTKCLLLLGEVAAHKYLPETINSTLSMIRGGLYYHKGIPSICSFLPQDATDIKNYESTNNPLSSDYSPDDKISDDDEDEGDIKTFGKTKRANYCFWIKADTRKCKRILAGFNPSIKQILPKYIIYPSVQEVIGPLTSTKNQYLYLDIETDYEQQNLQCFAFSFDGQTIYSVPILDYNYSRAYGTCHHILRALSIAIRDNVVVAHNGAAFDFFVLANKYHIPIYRTYDTMIAQHRCFPDIEKSLGHCVSYWTWEKFHKDEDSVGYRTHEQMMDRLKYCAKDVYTMFLVKQAIDDYARTIPGLQASICAAMDCIKPYLVATIQGIRVDEKKINETCAENDRLMFQYNRMIELLIGEVGMGRIREGKKMGLIAGSNKQCCKYFHELLDYSVVGRSKKTGEPSLGKKALYKLALQYENPVITLVCAYRAVQKETSRLRFNPWPSRYETLHTNNNNPPRLLDTPNCTISSTSLVEQQEEA